MKHKKYKSVCTVKYYTLFDINSNTYVMHALRTDKMANLE